ncbi:MAG: hypothetical protein Q4D14_07370 [Bacteroidales bacterium]|nr:hypothetical protein [Bacteroidales bacterium]
MKRLSILLISCTLAMFTVSAQETITLTQQQYDSILTRLLKLESQQNTKKVDAVSGATVQQKTQTQPQERLTFGGYAEAMFTRNFYSDSWQRHITPERYANDKGHNRFDLPHVCLYLGYEFGRGWRFGTEIEFEHGGIEAAIEMEADEAGEYETEIERGGEVALEQLWIEKTFHKALNLRIGEIIVPVGLTNVHHTPVEFFTAYRSEGENSIIPCTWHELGISIWGSTDKLRYEAMLLPGLDADRFSSEGWVHNGAGSPYEFKIANALAGAFRLDYTPIPSLRLGFSGYVGNSFINSLTKTTKYTKDGSTGTVVIGALDFEYAKKGLVARGNVDYGYLSDSYNITAFNKSMSQNSPSSAEAVAESAFAASVEIGYNVFETIAKLRQKESKLYIFGHYEYYDSMFTTVEGVPDYTYYGRHRIACGINYYPIAPIGFKAEYSHRFLPKAFNNEPSLTIGVVFSGLFKR